MTLTIDGSELDGLTVELEEDSFDFRLEFGRDLDIFWAIPSPEDGRLRLIHVDRAASHVDEPALYQDPWRIDVSPLRWAGNGAPILSVAFEATKTSYDCEVTVVGKTLRRSWRG